jgi:hypothetical protein
MSFENKLVEVMYRRKITSRGLSEASNRELSTSLINSFRKGLSTPTPRQTSVLSMALGIDMELFLNPTSKINNFNTTFAETADFKKVNVQNKDISKKDNIPIIPVDGSCTFPGCKKQSTENCHFSGYDQALFGKSLSKKVSNLFVADLCHDHHIYFDQPKERKSERMSSEFKTCILLSIKRKADRGVIVFKKNGK